MALRLDPQLVQAWNNKGLVLYEMGRFKDAQKAFQEALDLDNNNAHASFGKGQALYAPLAWVIIGGLISSTLLARIVTPVLYKLLSPAVEKV